jgi:hypothetical protein
LGPPGARCSTSSGLTNVTIANVLVTGVQLNSDGPTALITLMDSDLFSRCNFKKFKLKVEMFREISS